MKYKCFRCHKFKSRLHSRSGRQLKICTVCFNAHYKSLCKSEDALRRTAKEASKRARQRKEKVVLEHLQRSPCMDCGENNILVLEFDHRDPRKKLGNVGEMLAKGTSYERLEAEMDKCDVVCANCHRIRTAKRFGSWRLNIESHG